MIVASSWFISITLPIISYAVQYEDCIVYWSMLSTGT